MARYEGELIAAQEIAFDLGDLAKALAASSQEERARRLAMARLLSAAKGWKAAAQALDGTFAESLRATGLTAGEER